MLNYRKEAWDIIKGYPPTEAPDIKQMDKRQLCLGKRNQRASPHRLDCAMLVSRAQASPRVRLIGLSSSLEMPNVINWVFMVCQYSGDQVAPSYFSCSAVQPWQVLLINCIQEKSSFQRPWHFRRAKSSRSWYSQMSRLGYKSSMIYTSFSANVHIAWKSCFKLWTLSR